ncbi:MAG: MexH family multidrug efflux RND transporter periplasmic adaptor subunit [Candidatus Kapaibacterium sp.]|nr:MAG: MexH family multidrug efflux RND transporter periplasmic adaptor subunit [Candidatus Kapabacteria bacterium]
MNRLKWIIPVLILSGVVIAVLAHNKRTLQERRSQNVLQTIIPVVAEPARWDTVERTLELVGSILPNNIVQVASEANGRIVACNIELGRSVRQGDVLCVLDDELRRAQLMTAQANFEKAKSDSARYWFLKQQGSATDAQWEQVLLQYRLAEAQLIQARRALSDTRIKAPISGVITAKRVDVGTMVNPGTVVCEIVDASKLKMLLNVPEQDVFSLAVGDPVEVQSDALPGSTYRGRITAIAPKASDAHTFPVEVTITPPYGQLKAGMFARVRFGGVKPLVGLVIPRDAVLGSLRDARVFVVDSTTNTARERRIRCGAERNGYVVVLEGLSAGERVIVTGNNIVTDGTPIVLNTQKVEQ